jgi:hypothetical protein
LSVNGVIHQSTGSTNQFTLSSSQSQLNAAAIADPLVRIMPV